MRKILPLVASVLALSTGVCAARPLDVHVGGRARHTRIASYLVRHKLLTPQQAACASLVHAPLGSRRVAHLSVYERQGGRCPGVPQPPVYLFDVYVDTVSGVVDVTPEARDELDTVL